MKHISTLQRDSSLWTPRMEPTDRIQHYAIIGGLPGVRINGRGVSALSSEEESGP